MAEGTFYSDVYGWIDNVTPAAYDVSGTASPIYTLRDTSAHIERAYLSFDTSSIPSVATVEDATLRLYCDKITLPSGIDVGVYATMVWWEHDRIGASVSTGDWGFATYAAYKYWGTGASPPSLPWSADVDVPNGSIDISGDSDYELQDASNWADTTDGPRLGFYAREPVGTHRMWLTVTFSIPKGLFNRWNLRLPALPGFSSVIAAVILTSGDLKVLARFYPRPMEA